MRNNLIIDTEYLGELAAKGELIKKVKSLGVSDTIFIGKYINTLAKYEDEALDLVARDRDQMFNKGGNSTVYLMMKTYMNNLKDATEYKLIKKAISNFSECTSYWLSVDDVEDGELRGVCIYNGKYEFSLNDLLSARLTSSTMNIVQFYGILDFCKMLAVIILKQVEIEKGKVNISNTLVTNKTELSNELIKIKELDTVAKLGIVETEEELKSGVKNIDNLKDKIEGYTMIVDYMANELMPENFKRKFENLDNLGKCLEYVKFLESNK